MEKTYCIYCLINRINGKKYVGMTSQRLNNRWRRGKGYRGCEAIEQAFKEYGWESFEHIVLMEGLSFENACEEEKRFIKEFGCRYPDGYNIDGGGRKKRDIADRTKQKIGEKNRGRKASEETRAKMSAAQKGRVVSKEAREKISAANKGRVFSEESRKKMSDAKKRFRENTETTILISEKTITNQHKTDERLRLYAKEKRKPVLQYTKDGFFVARHESMREAAESVGGKHPNIFKCCNGIKKSMYGFVWKYEDQANCAVFEKGGD